MDFDKKKSAPRRETIVQVRVAFKQRHVDAVGTDQGLVNFFGFFGIAGQWPTKDGAATRGLHPVVMGIG